MQIRNVNKVKYILFFLILTLIIFYLVFRIKDIFSGPILTLTEINYVNQNLYLIKGNVRNVNKVYIYDREITLDKEGNFNEYVINNKYSNIKIKAIDKWDREATKDVVLE